MVEKIKDSNNSELILVSKDMLVYAVLGITLLTFLLMSSFFYIDFDSILGQGDLALKIGSTAIRMDEFKNIKKISGVRAQKMSNVAFAQELFEIVLLAEGARQQGLDKNEDFKEDVINFDNALKNASDSEKVARAIFLIEELAKLSVENITKNLPPINNNQTISPQPATQKIHLRTILVQNASEAEHILSMASTGVEFSELNASWSKSLYSSVGGDIGLKTSNDFPDGVFEKLKNTPIGSTTLGFNDENGFHLFLVKDKPQPKELASKNTRFSQEYEKQRQKSISEHLIELRNNLNCYIHPDLSIKCQN